MYVPSQTLPCVLGVANFIPRTNLVNRNAQCAGKRIFREVRNAGTDIAPGQQSPNTHLLVEEAETGEEATAKEAKNLHPGIVVVA